MKTVTETVYEKIKVPAELLRECRIPNVDGIQTNGDLEEVAILALEAARCGNDDKAAIRKWRERTQ